MGVDDDFEAGHTQVGAHFFGNAHLQKLLELCVYVFELIFQNGFAEDVILPKHFGCLRAEDVFVTANERGHLVEHLTVYLLGRDVTLEAVVIYHVAGLAAHISHRNGPVTVIYHQPGKQRLTHGLLLTSLDGSQQNSSRNGQARVEAVRAQRMHLGLPDATGRQQVEPIPGAHFTLQADLVIKALGFDPEDLPAMFNEPALPVTRWGTLKVDHRTMMTALPGVFAAGDIVRGASLVVWGIRDGRDVAEQIHAFIEARGAAPALAAE